jgi:hypothetical protein
MPENVAVHNRCHFSWNLAKQALFMLFTEACQFLKLYDFFPRSMLPYLFSLFHTPFKLNEPCYSILFDKIITCFILLLHYFSLGKIYF